MTGTPAEVTVESVEWILRHDPAVTPTAVGERLGRAGGSVLRSLRRSGRGDLADRLVGNVPPTGWTCGAGDCLRCGRRNRAARRELEGRRRGQVAS